ncbi:MAG: cupin domain-containing protein [Planctomycetota bacterium]|nr:cupin domain-containing protein [Planctomycetota bacterium]
MTRAILAAGEGREIRIRNGSVVFKTVGAETNGQVGIFEQTMRKGDPGPVPHFHRETTEMFFLLEGSLEFTLDGEHRTVEQGGFVRVPPNTVHHFSQRGEEPARFLIMFSPGKARERYFEGLAAIAAEDGPPDRAKLVALMHEYDQFLEDEDAYLDENY